MRESYSSGIANVLMQYGLFFDYVSGISAGSSTTVNYLSRDIIRTKHSFVDDVNDPDFGGIRTFMQGKGFFSAEYIYEIAGQSDGTIPFDFETFERNPAECVIGAFNADTGEMRYWDKSQLDSLEKMMRVVRASSTLPVIMPAINIEGHTYVDGGLQDSIPLAEAQRRGYEKFFVVATRPRDYRKSEPTPMNLYAARMLVPNWPHVQEAMGTRYIHYNATLDELNQLEAEGKAYVIYPDKLGVKSSTLNYVTLQESYDQGAMQALRDLPLWLRFLRDNLDERIILIATTFGLL